MGRTGWAIAFALILFFAGCLEATTTKVQDVCCQRVVNGECVELGNISGPSLDSSISLLSSGQCSLLSQVCYNVELDVSGNTGNITLPMCKYASQGYCNVSYTFLSYQKFYPKKEVNYDAAVQLFMFNNSTTTDYTPVAEKTPIKLLYAKPYLDTLPMLDLRKVNIYGIKFGVGRSFKQFFQYRNFFPFDYLYTGQNLYNPYFYVLSNKSTDICKYENNSYTCGNRSFRTFESCLLFCEMPDYSKPAIWDMNIFDLKINKSLGYMWFYRNVSFYDKDWNPVDADITGALLARVILSKTSLPEFLNRYEVGLFKRFADGPAPNLFTILNNSTKLIFEGNKFGLFLGGPIRFGGRSWVTLEDDNYSMRLINYSISIKQIASNKLKDINFSSSNIQGKLDTPSIYYLKNYYSVIELDVNASVKHEYCFMICWTTGGKVYNPLRIIFINNVTEIIAEEKQPLTYISKILPYAYYNRFFKNTSIHNKFPRLSSKGTFINFTGLPYECLVGEDNIAYCDNTYYERYSCIDKDTGEDIECGCTKDGCFAINASLITEPNLKIHPDAKLNLQDPYYSTVYSMEWKYAPTLKFSDDWKAQPTVNLTDTENWTGYYEHFTFSSRYLETSFGKAIAIPQSAIKISLGGYDGQDLKILGCFENYTGPDAVIICRSGLNSTTGDTFSVRDYLLRGSIDSNTFCNAILSDPSLFNKSFIRYPSNMNDTAYFLSVAFVVDVDGDNAFARCNISENNGNWGISIRSYGLPKPGRSPLTSAVQLITWTGQFNYTGSDRDDVVPAKHACGFADKNYRTIAYDDYRRVKGCYSGRIVNETRIKGPALTEDKNIISNYSYGFWNHLPSTESDLKELLIQGVQPILFIDDTVPTDYYTKLLRDVDNFIVVDAAIAYPFIQYTDFPLGSIIVVASNSSQKEAAKKACETCFVVMPLNFTVSPSSATFSDYSPLDSRYCDRPSLGRYTCTGVSTTDCSGYPWWDQNILFFTTKFTNIYSLSDAYRALENMIEMLDKSARFSGKPAYIYIYDIQPIEGTKYLMMAMSNLSTNFSNVGVMGIHFEDFDSYLQNPGSLVYEANELSRGLRASTVKSVQEVRLNRSNCDFIVSESDVPLTCINNTYPVMRAPGSNPLETENIIIRSRNFLQNSYKIALSNFLSGKYICNVAPDPETGEPIYYTYLPSITYLKGTMPVLFHEVYGKNNAFPLQPYQYSKENAKQCAPQSCTFKIKTVCEPVSCYEVKELIHRRGTITISEYTGYVFEEGLGTDWCKSNENTLTISGYGSFTYGVDRPIYPSAHYEDGCNFEREYAPFDYGDYTYVSTIEGNCSLVIDKTLTNNVSLSINRSNYILELPEVICTQGNPGWPSSSCDCKLRKISVSSDPGSVLVRDDYCKYIGDTVYAINSNRKITFPPNITKYVRYNETYSGKICYDQVYLDCSS